MNRFCLNNYKLQNVSKETLDLYIDGTLVDSQTEDIYKDFFDNTTSISYKTIRNTILEAKPKVLNIYINSPGGSVVEAMATHDFIQELKKKEVIVNGYGIGIVASASTYILSGCTHSYITPNSTYMIHNLSGGISGTIKEVESYYNMMLMYDGLIKDFYSNLTNKSIDQITQWMDSETFFTGKQAVENGFVGNLSQERTFTNDWKPEYFQFKNREVFRLYNSFLQSNNNNPKINLDMNKFQEALENVFRQFGFVNKEVEEQKKDTPITESVFRNSLDEALKNVVFEPSEEQLKNAVANFFTTGLPQNIIKQLGDVVTNEKIKELEAELEAVKTHIANSIGGAKPRNTVEHSSKHEYEGISYNN